MVESNFNFSVMFFIKISEEIDLAHYDSSKHDIYFKFKIKFVLQICLVKIICTTMTIPGKSLKKVTHIKVMHIIDR